MPFIPYKYITTNQDSKLSMIYARMQTKIIDQLLERHAPAKQEERNLFGLISSSGAIENNKTRDMVLQFFDSAQRGHTEFDNSVYRYRHFCRNEQTLGKKGLGLLVRSLRLVQEQSLLGYIFLNISEILERHRGNPALNARVYHSNNEEYNSSGTLNKFKGFIEHLSHHFKDVELIESIEYLLNQEISSLGEDLQEYLHAYKEKFYYSNLTGFELISISEANEKIMEANSILKRFSACSSKIPQHIINFIEIKQTNLIIQDALTNQEQEKENLSVLFKNGFKLNLLKIYYEHGKAFKSQPEARFGPLWEEAPTDKVNSEKNKPNVSESNYDQFLNIRKNSENLKINSNCNSKEEPIYPYLQIDEDEDVKRLNEYECVLYPDLKLCSMQTSSNFNKEYQPTKFEIDIKDEKYMPSAPPLEEHVNPSSIKQTLFACEQNNQENLHVGEGGSLGVALLEK